MSAHQLPGFRYVKPLGRGAHGEVHSAFEDRTDRWVAVKVLSAKVTGEAANERFVRECAALDGLSAHPHVVTVLDHGVLSGGQPYLTMELYPEGSLAEAVKLQGQMPVGDVLRLGVALAGALETAHRAGVVHRAVKPTNVLLAGTDQPALSDFALALVEEQQAAKSDESAPTPLHVAPEVLDGKPATPAADVYSLASTLYTALSGKTPVRQRDTPMLTRSDVPASLRAVLAAAMAREPGQRPPSALALSAVLQHAQRELGLTVTEPEVLDLPPVAAPPSPPAPAPPAPAAAAPTSESNGDRDTLPRLTSRTPTRPAGPPPKRPTSREFSEPSLDQLVALEQALTATPTDDAPATPGSPLRKPRPAPLRRRPEETPAAAQGASPLTARQRPSTDNADAPDAPAAEAASPPLTARRTATPEEPAADAPPPLAARRAAPETPAPELDTPSVPDPSEPLARRAADAAPLVVEPEPPAAAPPVVPAASVAETTPSPAPAPAPPAPPVEEQLPAWVTGGRGPAVDDDDRDDTAERPLPRFHQPPPERPYTPAPTAHDFPEPAGPRSGLLLPVVAAVAVTVAIAVVVWALALQPDDQGSASDDPEVTTTTTLQVPSGISAVESQAGVQLEWEGPDTAVYAILLMSETELPETIPAEDGSALLIPASSLRDDDGYCFAVAFLSSLNEVDDVTEAFSPVTCIRGATEETIRTD